MSVTAQHPVTRLIVRLWIAVSVLTAAGFFSAYHRATTDARDALTISQAVLVGTDGHQTQVSLPDSGSAPEGAPVERRYQVAFTLDGVPDDGLLLHVPYFEQKMDVLVGDHLVFDGRSARPWGGMFSHSTELVTLPPDRLHLGENTVTLVIRTGNLPPFSLSKVLIGTADQLQQLYLLRAFLEDTLRAMLIAVQGFLAFVGLIAFALRPGDRVFGWLGSMMTLSTMVGLGIVSRIFPGIGDLTVPAVLMIPAAGLAVLGFTLSLVGRPADRPIVIAMVAVTTVLFGLVYGFGASPRPVGYLAAVPANLILVGLSAAILSLHVRRDPRLDTILFAIGLILLLVSGFHDFLVRAGRLESGVFLGQFTRIVTLTAIALFLMRHQADIAGELDRAADNLRDRLAEREAELEEVHAREREREAARAIDEERSRITANLHDGVAGHLATIVALADRPDDLSGDIKTSARNALADLRLVIDALGVEDAELQFFLGQFRVRVIDPLERLGIKVDWSMIDLPDAGPFKRERALNVLRILQESVNNALRHGDGKLIGIRCTTPAPGLISISVRNSQHGSSKKQNGGDSSGLGLESMRRRAAELGGEIHFSQRADQAELVLVFPA